MPTGDHVTTAVQTNQHRSAVITRTTINSHYLNHNTLKVVREPAPNLPGGGVSGTVVTDEVMKGRSSVWVAVSLKGGRVREVER